MTLTPFGALNTKKESFMGLFVSMCAKLTVVLLPNWSSTVVLTTR